MNDIENENLAAHVSICQLRYESLHVRLSTIEDRIEKLETMIRDIHDSLSTQSRGNTAQWLQARDVVIAVLMGITAVLIQNKFF